MTVVRMPASTWRATVRHRVERTLVDRRRAEQLGRHDPFAGPAGDPGLFGPHSVTWRVHGDLPSMLVGGVTALLLQTLHPLAMAGVVDHSAYRTDPLGRLQRTAAFVGTTTFGSTDAALRAVAQVRAVHRRVRGVAPDGRPYDATDPALVTWVHVAEAWSFLRAYRRFGPAPLDDRSADRYLQEMAVVAGLLGAEDVPTSLDQVRRYLAEVRPELRAGAQALSGAAFIIRGGGQSLPAGPLVDQAARAVLVQAAIGLLPRWAADMLGLRRPVLAERLAMGMTADVALAVLRWSLGESPALAAARQRCVGHQVEAPGSTWGSADGTLGPEVRPRRLAPDRASGARRRPVRSAGAAATAGDQRSGRRSARSAARPPTAPPSAARSTGLRPPMPRSTAPRPSLSPSASPVSSPAWSRPSA